MCVLIMLSRITVSRIFSFSYASKMDGSSAPAAPPPSAKRPTPDFRPIRIDNWGVFLLQKLHNFYRREEACDLELVLSSGGRGAKSVRVHSSVLHVCTDYFKIELERQKTPGRVTLPESVSADSLMPIVQFLYTGKLSLNQGNFEAIYRSGKLLGLDMLTKLMESQLQQCLPNKKFPVNGKNFALPDLMEDSSATATESRTGGVESNGEAVKEETRGRNSVDQNGRKKFNYSKVIECRQNPNPVKSIYTTDPVKKLTTSDVFLKYSKKAATSSTSAPSAAPVPPSDNTKVIMDLIKKNPQLINDEKPTKLKIKQKSANGHERLVSVTVRVQPGPDGRKNIQIVQSPNYDADPVRPEGPWTCNKCVTNGKVLEFDSYASCRVHMTEAHKATFDANTCDRCGERGADMRQLAKHRLEKHSIPLPDGMKLEDCATEEKPPEINLLTGLSKKKATKKKFSYKKARWGSGGGDGDEAGTCPNNGEQVQSADDMEGIGSLSDDTDSDHVDTLVRNLESLERQQRQQQPTDMDTSTFVNCSLTNMPFLFSDPQTTPAAATGTTSTTALPNFQEVRNGLAMTNPSMVTGQQSTAAAAAAAAALLQNEPVQVLNLAVPVNGDDSLMDPTQQAIFIFSDEQGQYFFDSTATTPAAGYGVGQSYPMDYQMSTPASQVPQASQQHQPQQPSVFLPSGPLPSMADFGQQLFLSPTTAATSVNSQPQPQQPQQQQQSVQIPTFTLPPLEQCDIMRDLVNLTE